MSSLTVPARFRGPSRSGNGGWTAGTAAAHLDPTGRSTVTVTLRQPPPLDRALPVTTGEGELQVHDQDALVLEAALDPDRELTPVVGVAPEVAREATGRYAGLTHHPFPGCFACGTDREPGDGLRIWPGPVADDDHGGARVAATWTPDPALAEGDEVPLGVAWAALDCVGAWAGDLTDRSLVLGRMTARVGVLPEPGREVVVVGGARGEEGRKIWTAATLSVAGQVIATAEHTWIAVDPASFDDG